MNVNLQDAKSQICGARVEDFNQKFTVMFLQWELPGKSKVSGVKVKVKV